MLSLSSQNARHKTLLIWSDNKKGTQTSLRMDVMALWRIWEDLQAAADTLTQLERLQSPSLVS